MILPSLLPTQEIELLSVVNEMRLSAVIDLVVAYVLSLLFPPSPLADTPAP